MGPPTTILSLPNELLVAIAASGQHDHGPHTPVTSRSEWILSHLCRRFRDTIIAAPALWTNISISLSISWKKLQDRQQYEEILRLYLRRSIPLTVSVSLRIVVFFLAGVVELFTKWLHQIAPEMERVRSLSVDLGLEADDMGLALAPLRHLAAPNLVSLNITNHNTSSLLRCPFELFSSGTPKLSSVQLNGLLPFPIPSWMSSSSLTHLEVRAGQKDLIGDDTALLSSIVMRPIALVHLHLDLTGVVSTAPTDPQFRIPSLQSLSIHINENHNQLHLAFILDLFDCPVLTELAIAGSHGDQIFYLFQLLVPSVPRSTFPVLRSLSFIYEYAEGCSCREDTFLGSRIDHSNGTLLFPALSSLSLVGQCFTARLVKEILGAQALPWPHLKTLTLSPIKSISDVRKALQDAVQRSPLPIPKLRLGQALFFLEDWQDGRVDVEVFDPEEILKPFRKSCSW